MSPSSPLARTLRPLHAHLTLTRPHPNTIPPANNPSSIIADPKNPALYTNRALARLKLGLHDMVIDDCTRCLELAPGNMKAHYYLSQAQLATRDYDSALSNALSAHSICARTADKSLGAVTGQVLSCKKERWDELEKRRIREGAELEAEALELLGKERDEALRGLEGGERGDVEAEWDAKMATMRRTFEAARSADSKRRQVPDWAIDDISFAFMVDPVMVRIPRVPPGCRSLLTLAQTKTGKSYERASIMEHLRRSPTDPLTREPLVASDLRPNLNLKQACEEFLDENGWAVDW